MAEQYAGLTLGVDVSQVDKAVTSLQQFARANDEAAWAVDDFVNQEVVAKQKAKEFGDQLIKQRKEFQNLEAVIDPTLNKMARLRVASEQLDEQWSKGQISDKKFYQLSEMLETQNNALVLSRKKLTEEGRAAIENSKQKEAAAKAGDSFIKTLQMQVDAIGKTSAEMMQMKAAQLGVGEQAAPLIAALNNQTNSMKLAGLSAGQYKQAMQMLPAQITDVVTSLSSGMPVWMVAIQQGGQIKDSFGGVGNTFRVLLSYLNPVNVGIAATVGALGALVYSVVSANKEIKAAQDEVTNTIGMTGDAAQKLALNIREIANVSGQSSKDVASAFITAQDSAEKARDKLIDVGFSYDQASAMVDKYKGSSNFTNLNAEIEAHKLEVLGIKSAWSDAAEEVKNYYTAADKGKQDVALGGAIDPIVQLLERAKGLQKEVTEARIKGNQIVANTVDLIKSEYFASDRVAGAERQLAEARKNANIISKSGNKEAIDQANKLIKIRQREVEEAKKAEAKRGSKKPGSITKSPTEQFDREIYSLQAQLKLLQQHATINDKISSQRKSLLATEATITVLNETASRRKLTKDEQALKADQEKVLALARQKAELGDQIMEQQRLNDLQDKSMKFVLQMNESTKALTDSSGMGDMAAKRAAELAKIKSDWIASGGNEGDAGLEKMYKAQNEYYAAEDRKRSDWLAGAKNAFANYGEAATDMYSNVGQVASSAMDGMATMMTDFLMTGKANFASFAKSIIEMIIKMTMQMVVFNSISGALDMGGGFSFAGMLGGHANGGVVGGSTFAGGGYTGDGGKYQPAGLVHKGEFVMTKESTRRIGVANLYKLMRGYASGGAVGGTSGISYQSGSSAAAMLNIGSMAIEINGIGGTDPKGMESGIRTIITQMLNESCTQGGEIYNFVNAKTGG